EDGGGGLGLEVEDVGGGVAARTVTVIERAAEGGGLFRVAVAADGEVVRGEHERELLAGDRLAVDQGAGALEVAGVVEAAVAAEPLVAVLAIGDRTEDAIEQLDLLL